MHKPDLDVHQLHIGFHGIDDASIAQCLPLHHTHNGITSV